MTQFNSVYYLLSMKLKNLFARLSNDLMFLLSFAHLKVVDMWM